MITKAMKTKTTTIASLTNMLASPNLSINPPFRSYSRLRNIKCGATVATKPVFILVFCIAATAPFHIPLPSSNENKNTHVKHFIYTCIH